MNYFQDEYLQPWKSLWLILKKKLTLRLSWPHHQLHGFQDNENLTVGVSLIKVKKYKIHPSVKISNELNSRNFKVLWRIYVGDER